MSARSNLPTFRPEQNFQKTVVASDRGSAIYKVLLGWHVDRQMMIGATCLIFVVQRKGTTTAKSKIHFNT